jgi:methionyl-tRNA formyltransferase
MNILVLSDNNELRERAIPIFKKRNQHKWTFSFGVYKTKGSIEYFKGFDLILSLHSKWIFPKDVVKSVRCVNIHPGLRRGMFTHVYDILWGTNSGCVIHEMDEDIDTGPILFRHGIEVRPTDTSESLYNRIVDAELALLELHLDEIIDGSAKATPREKTEYHSFDDFKNMCDISPYREGTFREFYNLLRALSHGDYKNAHIGDTYLTLKIHENGNP